MLTEFLRNAFLGDYYLKFQTSMKQMEERIKKNIEAYKAEKENYSNSPIYQLPPEILIEIFKKTMKGYDRKGARLEDLEDLKKFKKVSHLFNTIASDVIFYIERLDLRNAVITDKELVSLIQRCPHIKYINKQGCLQISKKSHKIAFETFFWCLKKANQGIMFVTKFKQTLFNKQYAKNPEPLEKNLNTIYV